MNKINYRVIVNIKDTTMNLGFRGKVPGDEKYQDVKIRVQAVFMQRQLERRYPMEVQLIQDEDGKEIIADAKIELPYVFTNSPRHKVNVTFALWIGMEEIILDDQPFPVQKELFSRPERILKRNPALFTLGTASLPFLVMKNLLKIKGVKQALKQSNTDIYDFSGYTYSKRQRKTDYFATQYEQFVKNVAVRENEVLFLSERMPEAGGNLQRIKNVFENDPQIHVSEFIVTKTVDALSGRELRLCAELCAKARVIILEDFYPQLHSLSIRKETKVVQLWHACGAFKTFGFTRLGKPGGAPQKSMNHRNYDLVPVSSEAMCGIYAEAFGITTSKVKALGVPRTDILFDESYKRKKKEELYKKYPAMEGKKIVLFAPTFRGDGNKDAYYPADAFDVNRFLEEQSADTFCIVKHHPFVQQEFVIEEGYRDRVLDLTGKDHINDLLILSDLLITDYSSSVFEAAILGVPMLFYAFDKEEYVEKRDFYSDFDSFAPGYIEETFEGMCMRTFEILSDTDKDKTENSSNNQELIIRAKRRQFIRDYLSALDGNSTARIASYIKETYL